MVKLAGVELAEDAAAVAAQQVVEAEFVASLRESSPMTVRMTTCGERTSSWSSTSNTLSCASAPPSRMMVLLRWSAMSLVLPTVASVGVVSTGAVSSPDWPMLLLPPLPPNRR